MPYVSRDDNCRISGVFANRQPGFAEEHLADDNPELLAFLNPATRLTIAMPDTTPTTLNADPINDLDAVTRRYLDERLAQLTQTFRRA